MLLLTCRKGNRRVCGNFDLRPIGCIADPDVLPDHGSVKTPRTDVLMDGETALQEGREIPARRMNLVLGRSSAITAFNPSRMGARVAFARARTGVGR